MLCERIVSTGTENRRIQTRQDDWEGEGVMTYEEAFEILRDTSIYINSARENIYTDYATAQMMALNSIEKQIPKKAKIKSNAITECAECDTCIFLSDRYCPRCGQAIDWSGKNDR